MNEEQINNYLKKTLRLHLKLKKQGKEELAWQVLQIGSFVAEAWLTTKQIRNTYHRGVYCPICHGTFTDKNDILSIQKSGECLGCEHIRGEVLQNERMEWKKNEKETN